MTEVQALCRFKLGKTTALASDQHFILADTCVSKLGERTGHSKAVLKPTLTPHSFQ